MSLSVCLSNKLLLSPSYCGPKPSLLFFVLNESDGVQKSNNDQAHILKWPWASFDL